MFAKSAWLAAALAACLLTVSSGTALAGGGHGWGHGGYYKKHHGKHFGHRGFKHFRHHGHKGFGHFRGHKRFRHFGHRGFRHFGHRKHRHVRPFAFNFVFRIADTYEGYAGSRIVRVEQRYAVAETLAHAADGEGIVWNGPESKAEVRVVPTESYEESGGRYCREFLTTAHIGGTLREAYGQACRQPDGTWQIVR